MDVIKSNIQTQTEEFRENQTHMTSLVAQLPKSLRSVSANTENYAVPLHRSRGKLPIQERIQMLFYPGAHFLEFIPLVAWEM